MKVYIAEWYLTLKKTVRSISEAVKFAEKQADMSFKEVHVGIAGQHIKSLQTSRNVDT